MATTPAGWAGQDDPVPVITALPTVAAPDQFGPGRSTESSSPPVAASRTCRTPTPRAGPLNVIPPATVVGANEAALSACQVTAPVPALKACTVGCCMAVSRGLPGSHKI